MTHSLNSNGFCLHPPHRKNLSHAPAQTSPGELHVQTQISSLCQLPRVKILKATTQYHLDGFPQPKTFRYNLGVSWIMYCLTWTLSITLCDVALAYNHSQPLPLGWSGPGYLLLTAVNLGLTTTRM